MMMLYSGLLEQPIRVLSTTPTDSVDDQTFEGMADQTHQHDDEAMRDGNGDPFQELVPVIHKVEEPEEQIVALQAADLSFLQDVVAQSGARIFVHAPQYHWRTSGTGGIDQEARERLVAFVALASHFGQQTEDCEEVLASRIDTKIVARAHGLVEFQEFLEIWIGKIDHIHETWARLTWRVNTQGVALKNLELDLGSMCEEIQGLDQVDDANRAASMQKMTQLQHKIQSALQDRHAAHQPLQKRLHLMEKRVTGWEQLQDNL